MSAPKQEEPVKAIEVVKPVGEVKTVVETKPTAPVVEAKVEAASAAPAAETKD